MAKADGKYIVLEFSEELNGDLAENAACFHVFAPMASASGWVSREIGITAVEWYGGRDKIRLSLGDTNQDSLQGMGTPVTVRYAGGRLLGEFGPLPGLSASFIPDGCPYRGNQYHPEHVTLSGATASVTLTKINYLDDCFSPGEHITGIQNAAAGWTLTHIDNI